VPPPQQNLSEAISRAVSAFRRQSPEQLEWLGAKRDGEMWKLLVMNESMTIDAASGDVTAAGGRPIGPWWQVLTLHYLAVTGRPHTRPPAIGFAELPAGRAYAPVYHQRVIARLCRTVGCDEASLQEAACAVGGQAVAGGDLAFDFQALPRITLRLVWYAGDEELSPSAVLLLPDNVESFFCVEDIVVLSERLVLLLGGGRF